MQHSITVKKSYLQNL